MREQCERCRAALPHEAAARICSYECTFCPACSDAMGTTCPNCGGGLVARPRRRPKRCARARPWISSRMKMPSAVGLLVITARDERLVSLAFDDCRGRMLAELAARYGPVRLTPARDPFGISRRINAYLAGDLGAVDDISVDPAPPLASASVGSASARAAGSAPSPMPSWRRSGRRRPPRARWAARTVGTPWRSSFPATG